MPINPKKKSELKKTDWTLLVIASSDELSLTPVQLQKIVFLIGENLKEYVGKDYYHFTPYHYGPFDSQVYEDAERLESLGLIRIEKSANQKWNEYSATKKGIAAAAELAQQVPSEFREYLKNVVKWATKLSFQELVSAIYNHYPRFKKNSVFSGM